MPAVLSSHLPRLPTGRARINFHVGPAIPTSNVISFWLPRFHTRGDDERKDQGSAVLQSHESCKTASHGSTAAASSCLGKPATRCRATNRMHTISKPSTLRHMICCPAKANQEAALASALQVASLCATLSTLVESCGA